MTWVYIAISAYFLAALNSVIDKYILKSSVSKPLVYAFYVGLFSIFSIALTPFGFEWPGFVQFGSAIFAGMVFLLALISFFTVLRVSDVSRVVSIVGGVTPIFILLLSSIIFGSVLSINEYYALIFLITGTILISIQHNPKFSIFQIHKHSFIRNTEVAVLSAFLFALFFVSAKYVFENQAFISGFVWTRIGSFIAALSILLIPSVRKSIFYTTKAVGIKVRYLFVVNKTLAGISFFMLNYSIAIGNATLVNALGGVKYVFLLVLVFFLSVLRPNILHEEFSLFIIFQKSSAIVLIFFGILILSGYSFPDFSSLIKYISFN